jgi:hypothetical protein
MAMRISGVGANPYILGMLDILATDSSSDTDDSSGVLGVSSSGSSASSLYGSSKSASDISETASLLSEMSRLQSQDPDKFKDMAKDIAEKLHEEAKDSDDSTQSFSLDSLASQFSNAALTGSMKSLLPASSGASKAYGTTRPTLLSLALGGDDDSTSILEMVNSVVAKELGSLDN